MLTLAMMHKHQTITSCLEVEEYDSQGSAFFSGKGSGKLRDDFAEEGALRWMKKEHQKN